MDRTGVLTGRDMLCFSHDWSGDPLSKTHLMRLMARDNRVLWVNSIGYRAPQASARDLRRAIQKVTAALEPIKEVEKNIFVLNPLVIPLHGIPWMRVVNRELLRLQVMRAMNKLGMKRPINWVFNPAAGVIAGALGEETLVYYCVDEYTAFSGVATNTLLDLEERLIRRADVVIVSADRLYKSKAPKNPNTHLIRHGVDFEHFRKALSPDTVIPPEIANLPHPIIGYFGLMAEDWIDIDLMVHIAKHFSTGSMVLLGKVTTDVSRLQALPNVHFLGRKEFSELPAYSKGFDAAFLPFPISEVTLNANPLKIREYLAAGLPTVSTAIPEVEVLNLCAIAKTKEEFVAKLEEALKKPGPSVELSDTMKGESWEGRLVEIAKLVNAAKR
jgi:glycosyltransferase involved in cell wall biosynthesis